MSTLVGVKLALVVIGLVIWFHGYRTDDSWFLVTGIIFLLVAVLLRFVGRRRPAPGDDDKEGPAP
jgi:cell division protein FtsW (lipid II flippase)